MPLLPHEILQSRRALWNEPMFSCNLYLKVNRSAVNREILAKPRRLQTVIALYLAQILTVWDDLKCVGTVLKASTTLVSTQQRLLRRPATFIRYNDKWLDMKISKFCEVVEAFKRNLSSVITSIWNSIAVPQIAKYPVAPVIRLYLHEFSIVWDGWYM